MSNCFVDPKSPLKKLTVKGAVKLEDLELRGDFVSVINNSKKEIIISPEILKKYDFDISDNRIILENINIVVDEKANLFVEKDGVVIMTEDERTQQADVVDVSANESNITTVATNIEDVQNAANLIETVYSVLNGGTASSQFTEGVSGGDASSTFTTRITGGNGRSVGTIIGDIQSNIRVIELNQRNDETNIAHLRADLTTETNERITTDISLQGQIDDINDEIILINQNADSLDGRITTNTDDITDAFNQIHSNDDDIAAIQLVNASQSLDISYLQSDVTTLKAEAKEVYSILSGGTASSSFTESVSGGDAATSFTSKIIGGSASSVGSLLADAYNLIRTLTSRLSEAFNEIALLKNKDIDLQSEINAINSITGISGGTASSVFS